MRWWGFKPDVQNFEGTCAVIRKRRFVWLGHILRMEGDRLVKHAVARQHSIGLPGNMFYDVPPHLSFEQIEAAASDRKLWKRLGTLLKPHDSTGLFWANNIHARESAVPKKAETSEAKGTNGRAARS